MKFNPLIHVTNEHGDPIRTAEGELRLRTNWEKIVREQATDRMGRTYNPVLHGEKPEIDDEGKLKVQSRTVQGKPMGSVNLLQALKDEHAKHLHGYDSYIMNDEPGRMERMRAAGWEPVLDNGTVVRTQVGQARQPGTQAILMRKPTEWRQEETDKQAEYNRERLKASTAPAQGSHGKQYIPDRLA